MTLASEYEIMSKDRKKIILPDDVLNWIKDADKFVVVMENDGLILKKAYSRRTLEELVTKRKAPLSGKKLNELIHESRK